MNCPKIGNLSHIFWQRFMSIRSISFPAIDEETFSTVIRIWKILQFTEILEDSIMGKSYTSPSFAQTFQKINEFLMTWKSYQITLLESRKTTKPLCDLYYLAWHNSVEITKWLCLFRQWSALWMSHGFWLWLTAHLGDLVTFGVVNNSSFQKVS